MTRLLKQLSCHFSFFSLSDFLDVSRRLLFVSLFILKVILQCINWNQLKQFCSGAPKKYQNRDLIKFIDDTAYDDEDGNMTDSDRINLLQNDASASRTYESIFS